MCLYISYKERFVAKDDITVYKYVNEKDGKYELIRDIFEECESTYCGGTIWLVEDDTNKN